STSTANGDKTTTMGAMMIKAAWRDMTGVPQADWNRYYVVNAQVYDPKTGQCAAKPAGLVGLHIVQKLDDFPEWVWSTFEQVDVLTTPKRAGLLPACTDTNCSVSHGFANRPSS